MARYRQQKIFKLPQYVRADGIALITCQEDSIRLALALIHVEVVEPEIRKHLLQLPVGVDCAIELGLS